MTGQLLCACSDIYAHPDSQAVNRLSIRQRAVTLDHAYGAPIPAGAPVKHIDGLLEHAAVCSACVQAGHAS